MMSNFLVTFGLPSLVLNKYYVCQNKVPWPWLVLQFKIKKMAWQKTATVVEFTSIQGQSRERLLTVEVLSSACLTLGHDRP